MGHRHITLRFFPLVPSFVTACFVGDLSAVQHARQMSWAPCFAALAETRSTGPHRIADDLVSSSLITATLMERCFLQSRWCVPRVRKVHRGFDSGPLFPPQCRGFALSGGHCLAGNSRPRACPVLLRESADKCFQILPPFRPSLPRNSWELGCSSKVMMVHIWFGGEGLDMVSARHGSHHTRYLFSLAVPSEGVQRQEAPGKSCQEEGWPSSKNSVFE